MKKARGRFVVTTQKVIQLSVNIRKTVTEYEIKEFISSGEVCDMLRPSGMNRTCGMFTFGSIPEVLFQHAVFQFLDQPRWHLYL